MYTSILEYRHGTIKSRSSTSSSTRMNKLPDGTSAINRHTNHLESVQLILRTSEMLRRHQQVKINNGKTINKHASTISTDYLPDGPINRNVIVASKSTSISTSTSLDRLTGSYFNANSLTRMPHDSLSSLKTSTVDEIHDDVVTEGDATFFLDGNYKFGGVCNNNNKDNRSTTSFAGCRNYLMPEIAICGATGTIRGMRNRVRAGIATFRQQASTTTNQKNFVQMEFGKVVVYTTSTGIVRKTFQQCLRVKTILSTLMVAFEERDIFKCGAYRRELTDRLRDKDAFDNDNVRIPQVFIEGHHLGDAKIIDELNECGRLRKILCPYQRSSADQVCQKCGGYLLLLCPACNGSKKSVTRNKFTDCMVPLRCTKCDECGLIQCDVC